MSVIDEILAHNEAYANQFTKGSLPMPPAKRLAAVVCMDARLETGALLALVEGDAHVIRNAGGVVTDDVIRSLTLSQRYLGTREVVVISHTDCGLSKVAESAFRAELLAELGVEPDWPLEAFTDPADAVRRSLERLEASPFVVHTDHVRGFVYDVDTRLLTEVD